MSRRKSIDQSEYLQLLGLLALAERNYRMLEEIEEATGELLQIDPHDRERHDFLDEHVFSSEPNAHRLLEQLEIEVHVTAEPAGR